MELRPGNGVVCSRRVRLQDPCPGLPSVIRRRSLCRKRAGACPQLAAGTSDMEAKEVQLEEVGQEAPAPQLSLGRLLQTEPQQPRKQQRTGYPVLPQLVRAAGRNSDGGSSNASHSGDARTTNVSGAATSGSSAGNSNNSSGSGCRL
ncbi:hypothetical protein CHLRE_17g736618v5 [Chlamydomonas reinhardtii]|uniref:Uncharacterized protein n=1 Tax=Chlamydomonas reinhardtii TaxID=3055 RepID=A0A2K3CRF4_CHLRE|nr:uncharacterized protein CHLRE_17g736618v5 [Chlamydomonas reinhardtii]PNW70863.1 hypothetical protein CHLRE_17g736618v5 [Chlamydomonas reinhardtii]